MRQSTTRLALLVLLIIAALCGGVPGPAHGRAPSAVAAPRLKWQYATCATPPHYCETGWYASPAVADLDGDSRPEVIWGQLDLFAINGESGSTQWKADGGGRIWPGIALADLTGDGSLEIVAGRSGSSQLTVYNSAGGVIWERSPFRGEVRTLAVTDLEQDGRQEIVVGRASSGATEQVSVYESTGSVRSGWPARRTGEPGYGAGMYNQNIAIADMDGDGDKELFAPTDTHYITALDRGGNQLPANAIYGAGEVWSQVGVHVDHAADLRGFAECGTEHRPNFAESSPVISDMDGNGTLELVVVGSVYNCAVDYPEGNLYHLPWILRHDRTRWSGGGANWTVLPTPEPGSAPVSNYNNFERIENAEAAAAVADLDGDGRKEIVYPSYDGRLHAYWLDKTQHGAWPFDVPGSGIRFASEPAVVDLDNDGQAEVIITSWPEKGGGRVGQLHILSADGQQLHALNLPAPGEGSDWNGGLGAPTVANIDADSDMEVVVGTSASGLVAYDLPGTAAARCLWCTGRGSYNRTGVAASSNSFMLQASPSGRVIAPGRSTTFAISAVPDGAFRGTVSLNASAAPAGLSVQIAPGSLAVPGSATLTLTDTRNDPPTPGRAYTITVTASSGNIKRTVQVRLLVGGSRTYMPLTRR